MKKPFSLCFALAVAGASASAEQATILVLDESGSMWAQLPEGRSRIEIARDVLGDYLASRDMSAPLGVIAYGHNRKGDCGDIEVIAPVGLQDAVALTERLRSLMPQGKTPLADALRLAGNSIPLTAEEADIVLITDGLENCGGDPCAVASEMELQGIPVRAHVVGFGLTEDEIAQVSCVAEATGGQVLLAQSGEELAAALQSVEQMADDPDISLLPIDAFMGEALPFASFIVTDSSGSEIAREEEIGVLSLELAPGAYSVAASAPGYVGAMSFEVAEGMDSIIDVYLDRTDAHVFLYAVDEDSWEELAGASWTLVSDDGSVISVEEPGDRFILVPPGYYRIEATIGDRIATQEQGFDLGDYTVTLPMPPAAPEATLGAVAEAAAGSIIDVNWTGPDEPQDYIVAVPLGSPDDAEGNLVRTYRGNPAQLKLPDDMGEYELRYVSASTGNVLARQYIYLFEQSAYLETPESATAGATIDIYWEGPDNQNDFITVVLEGAADTAEGNLVRTYRGNPAKLQLPDALGAYEIRYVMAQSGRVLARNPVKLNDATATLDVLEDIRAGNLFTVSWTGPNNQNDYITITPIGAPELEKSELARTYRGSPASLRAPPEAGAYELRYVLAQSRRVLTAIEVEVKPTQ